MCLRLHRTPSRRKSGQAESGRFLRNYGANVNPGERPFRRGPVRSKASADLPEVDMIEGDARDEGTLTCSFVVTGAESPRLMHDPEAVSAMQRVDFSRVQEPTYCRTVLTISTARRGSLFI